jgi:hypothetical protein
MSESVPTPSGGIGFVGALTLLFVACKLFGVINWSWWWVLAPIWISWIFILIVLAFIFGIAIAVGGK